MASDEGKRYMRGYTWSGLSNAEQEDALALLEQLRGLRVTCPECGGTGKWGNPNIASLSCNQCNGTGTVNAREKHVGVVMKNIYRERYKGRKPLPDAENEIPANSIDDWVTT